MEFEVSDYGLHERGRHIVLIRAVLPADPPAITVTPARQNLAAAKVARPG